MNPYAEIEKVPLYAADNMQSSGYSVRIEDDASSSGWDEVGLVSESYLLVPNRQVRDMALEITRESTLTWAEEKVFFDGKRYLLALTAEPDVAVEVKVGDFVSLGMLFENSYDGSRKLAASLFAYRLACKNGMLTSQHFARIRFKHDSTSAGWDDEITRALSMLGTAEAGLERFADGAKRLAEMPMGSAELSAVRRQVLGSLPITVWGKVVDRFLLEEEHTGWGLLNAGTHLAWHEDRSIRDYTRNESITEGLIEYATANQEATSHATAN